MKRRNFVKQSLVSPFAASILVAGLVVATGYAATVTCFSMGSSNASCRNVNGVSKCDGTSDSGGGPAVGAPCDGTCKADGTMTC